ncbi:MAG: hypothetical protein L0211_15600 [Planctomycetaceae bacterium]|nr:hypothetical protein [Planctomycetaceae bacterium]
MAKARLVVIEQLALLELEQGRSWYESKLAGLGFEFVTEVDATIARIRESPEMYACHKKEFRQALVRRFPFAIYYEFQSGTVTIYSIFNCSQDPAKLDERLP